MSRPNKNVKVKIPYNCVNLKKKIFFSIQAHFQFECDKLATGIVIEKFAEGQERTV